MYRGLLPVLSSLYCSNFVYFYTFNGFKAAYISKNSPETAMVDLLFGFLAGENELTVIFQRRDRTLPGFSKSARILKRRATGQPFYAGRLWSNMPRHFEAIFTSSLTSASSI